MTDATTKELLAEFFVSNQELETDRTLIGLSTAPELGDERVEMLGFNVSGELYALAITDVREIIPASTVTEVPRVDPCILGVISLRGAVMPLVDARRILRLEEHALTRSARVIVVGSATDPVGLLVDSIVNVIRLGADTIAAAPVNLQGDTIDLIEGMGQFDGEVVVIVDVRALLRRLSAMAAKTASR